MCVCEKEQAYHVGQITLCKHKGDSNEHDVVDGQQRVTTICLVLAACNAKLKSNFSVESLMQARPLRSS